LNRKSAEKKYRTSTESECKFNEKASSNQPQINEKSSSGRILGKLGGVLGRLGRSKAFGIEVW